MRDYDTKETNSWKKSGIKPKDIPKEQFIEICKSSESMAYAASRLGLHFGTFRKYAEKYSCYKTNQAGKGTSKNILPRKFCLYKWNNNELIPITRANLRKWIFKAKLIPLKCNKCSLDSWLERNIPLELNHINGNGHDNRKYNIELLCPNCHALTDTYRGRNK
jgi:hypothetical protein